LRNETSLIQTIGRAARNAEAYVILYADTRTKSIDKAVSETERRRSLQKRYNDEHGITPETIRKDIAKELVMSKEVEEDTAAASPQDIPIEERIAFLEKQMKQAAAELEFEAAAKLRDEIKKLKEEEKLSPWRKS
ncbi:MAG: UvrB/UvrC motif-containing protein, partial [Christensenellaceae bacterium]|nr:UvrB/UvrC motif-containing protein [Christensenellaceae bacterium]